jgi:DNA-binding MarR family transcriptional regulator
LAGAPLDYCGSIVGERNALGVDSMKAAAAEDQELDLGPLNAAWVIGGPDSVAVRLSFVAKLFDRYLTRQLSEVGLTVAEWRVMAQLSVVADNTVRELALQAWVDRAEVSRAVASLARRGLVARRPDPQDKRSPRFSLTPAGRALGDEFRPQWRALQKRLADRLQPQELAFMNAKLAEFARLFLDLLHDEE